MTGRVRAKPGAPMAHERGTIEEALARLFFVHRKISYINEAGCGSVCAQCYQGWPCETAQDLLRIDHINKSRLDALAKEETDEQAE